VGYLLPQASVGKDVSQICRVAAIMFDKYGMEGRREVSELRRWFVVGGGLVYKNHFMVKS
jgi:hypothetical protein